MKNIKLVLIDFDDTLCLTEKGCLILENDVAKQLGYKPMTRKHHLLSWGKPIEEAVPERFPGANINEFLKILYNKVPEYVEKQIIDDVSQVSLDMLRMLKNRNKKLAILTSRQLEEITHLIKPNHKLSNIIDKFYYKGIGKYSKPDPRVFDQTLKDFNVKISEVVYIGDTVSDALCAKSAGIKFIACMESGIRKKNDFKGIAVDNFVNKFSDVIKFIE